MGRTTWVKPMTLLQKFEANEPVAADQCFEIECRSNTHAFGGSDGSPSSDYPKWSSGEKFYGDLVFGKHDGCHTASNNIFNFDGQELTFVGDSGEIGNGAIDSIIDASNDGIVGNAGDRVYWYTTEDKGTRVFRWNHWGTLVAISDGHPLRS